ncbi:MAG: excinuclease ABC subunit UvrA [bacterium]|nr:excinuclease ABC subunit UvrA [bacterium]
MKKPENSIKLKGARVHNLKDVDVDIPKNSLVVITGLSGSGKSSLAFDTIYAEAERRFVESLSSYARQFLGVKEKPDIESIEGLSPAIAIDQKSISKNPRSTVGTITEIHDYLRLLYSRAGIPHCPTCGKPVKRQTAGEIIKRISSITPGSHIVIMAPIIRNKKGEHKTVMAEVERGGFLRVRLDGEIFRVEEARDLDLDPKKKHDIEVVIDRLIIDKELDRARLRDSVEAALKIGHGFLIVNDTTTDVLFSEHLACPSCGISLYDLEPRAFSFNSPYGACSHCTGLGSTLEVDPELVIPNKKLSLLEGAIQPWARASHKVGRQSWYWWMLEELATKHNFSLDKPVASLPKKIVDIILKGEGESYEGVIPNLRRRWKETDSDWTRGEIEKYMIEKTCEACLGKRLKPEALGVLIEKTNIADVSNFAIADALPFFQNYFKKAPKETHLILKEIVRRLDFLMNVGLEYMTLSRTSTTLAGGEAQRVRLATQIGSQLTGVIYVLDEPSIGLHSRDHAMLIKTIEHLRDLGNTVLVVEHDKETMQKADWIIDLGPGAGKHGGEIVFEGTYKKVLTAKTQTGYYLSGKKTVSIKNKKRKKEKTENWLTLSGAKGNNLQNVTLKLPLGKFSCITGVSGSGKSTLINDTLAKILLGHFYNARAIPEEYKEIKNLDKIDKVVDVDQSPIGRTPRSNPATYTGMFGPIRDLFSKTREARSRGYTPGRFSFNVKGGRCEECEGQGVKKIEMYFLPDLYQECEECKGQRYNKEALEIEYQNKNIAEVLAMSVEEAASFFTDIPQVKDRADTLVKVGLGYMKLGQPATTLSGGEAQRVKLATELARKSTGKTLYILDEPTTGLHFEDIQKLLHVLDALVERGNSVVVIEHNMDVIKNADWIIDLGPEGGSGGGTIIAEGTPEDIIKISKSYTGRWLKKSIK